MHHTVEKILFILYKCEVRAHRMLRSFPYEKLQYRKSWYHQITNDDGKINFLKFWKGIEDTTYTDISTQ
jgi:hypothetical protein